jgi:proline iminopeptidase
MIKYYRLLLFCILISLSPKISAISLSQHYINGHDICSQKISITEKEFSKRIDVPIDYNNELLGTTSIYTYLKKVFNPSWPTLLFFTGGPGVSSRSTEFDLPETNIIFFEQRGISCSRPELESTFLNPDFYSSINTARDAFEILKAYKLSQATIYGHSYGTIPATIFASLFKKQTRSLILEGVVFHADETLWRPLLKKKMLQNLFDQLPVRLKEKISYWSHHQNVPNNWFSKVGNMMMYLDDGITAYNIFLENVLEMPEENFIPFINNFYSDPNKTEETFDFGDIAFGMIACQEMSMALDMLSMNYVFDENDKLQIEGLNTDKKEYCDVLNISHDEYKTYKASRYPLVVPTYYLLGEHDGATSFEQGLSHFSHVAQGKKQLLKLSKGGHLPLLGLLKDYRDNQNESASFQATRWLKKMIHAEAINEDDLKLLNSRQELNWQIN